jgi:ABC-type spermidine/putrescine transport system permease subunit I
MAAEKVGFAAKIMLSHIGLTVATVVFVLLPLWLTLIGGVSTPPRPGGFSQGGSVLLALVSTSLKTSLGAASISTSVALLASALTLFSKTFSLLYRLWLTVMLFTNPIFLVLGFSSLLWDVGPLLAVTSATAYVVLPLGGLIIQSGVDQIPSVQIKAARSLGALPIVVLREHVLPAVRGQLELAWFLMSIYGLGFYLLPTFVGFGRIVTLGTAINTVTNRVGDWAAAQQLACVLIGLQIAILVVWQFARSYRAVR